MSSTLTTPATIAQAIHGSAAAANPAWLSAIEQEIIALPIGAEFITEDVIRRVEAKGTATGNRRACGAIVSRLARDGYIEKTGHARPAVSSHLSLKPIWRRV